MIVNLAPPAASIHVRILFFSDFQGYYDNPKVCAFYVMKGTLEGETTNASSSCSTLEASEAKRFWDFLLLFF